MKILFKAYRTVVSPALEVGFGVKCRYDESCSRYTERRIAEAGLLAGSYDGFKRILTCNGFVKPAAQHSEPHHGS